jgi:hypothetical protein
MQNRLGLLEHAGLKVAGWLSQWVFKGEQSVFHPIERQCFSLFTISTFPAKIAQGDPGSVFANWLATLTYDRVAEHAAVIKGEPAD